MKILHVITSMDPKKGGPSQGIRNINPFLIEAGLEVEVVCLDDPNSNIKSNIVVHSLGKGKTSYQFSINLIIWLNKYITTYDFISVHGIWQFHNFAVYNAISQLKKKGLRVPKVVVMPHGMLDPYFQKAPDRKLKAFRNEIVWRLTEKRSVNAADAIFFTCQEELELARTTFKGYSPKRELNVGYGVQRPPIFKEKMKIAFETNCPTVIGKNYWLFLGRIHPKKGIDLLIKSYINLLKNGNQLPDLVIAGPTDSDYAQRIVNLAGNNKKVHFSGMLTGDSKWGAFYGCEAYLLPSHQENFGIAIIEAMACKRPVFITKKVNIWREIHKGGCGWIIDEPNLKDITNCLNQIAKISSFEKKNICPNSFETFERNFLVDNSSHNFISALLSLK